MWMFNMLVLTVSVYVCSDKLLVLF